MLLGSSSSTHSLHSGRVIALSDSRIVADGMGRGQKDELSCYLSDRLAQSDSLHLLTAAYTAPIYTDSWDHGVYTEAGLNLDEHQRELARHVDRAFEDYSLGDYLSAMTTVAHARETCIRVDEWLSRMWLALQAITSGVTKDEAYDTRALRKQAHRKRIRRAFYTQ
jgi:hypothetical protein